ncbi:MAG TPA: DUF4190 domain-containing protein [Jiangellaceae bacterium]|nr:DUF4190 domain-containing protein [Jiangellaceae bacterium]
MSTNNPDQIPPRYETPFQMPHSDVPPRVEGHRSGLWLIEPTDRHYIQPQPTNGLAVASLVLGIVWAFWIGSALAIVFGHVALAQIAQKNEGGKGLAVAGLVLGYVGAATFALFVVLPLMMGPLA